MAEDAKVENKPKWWTINRKLLKLKLHYFLLYGGLGGIQPYLPLNAQQLGLTATAAGLVYTVLPFTYIFSKPIIGAITDRFHNMKTITMVLVMTTAILWCMILFIPPLELKNTSGTINIICENNSSLVIPADNLNFSCFESFKNHSFDCYFMIENCTNIHGNNTDMCEKECHAKMNINDSTVNFLSVVNNSSIFEIQIHNSSFCKCPGINALLTFCNTSQQTCTNKNEAIQDNLYATVQFWSFAVIMFLSGTALASALSITDAACYETLGSQSGQYGQQRLWGTISSGLASLLTGYIVDVVSAGSEIQDYAPGFYIMLIMLSLDLIVIYKLDMKQINFTEAVFKDVGRVFVSARNILFAVGAFVIGVLTPLVLVYETWFLKELGASQSLLGLTMAVECLLAEVPFLFISGMIIKKFGQFYCVMFAFVAFISRYVFYYFLYNPWYVLPIELFHGITYGVFYAALTSYAHANAPPGAEATMFGVLGGLYDGLGMAVGSILSGAGFDYLGSRQTFLVAAIVGTVSVTLFFVGNLSFTTRGQKKLNKN